jgi:hypothetical protein
MPLIHLELGDNCIVFENFTASIGDLMVANICLLALRQRECRIYDPLCHAYVPS